MERFEKDHGNRILRCHPDGTIEVHTSGSSHLPASVSRELQDIERATQNHNGTSVLSQDDGVGANLLTCPPSDSHRFTETESTVDESSITEFFDEEQ